MELYTVRPGDSLRSIARRTGGSAALLRQLNQLGDGARLIPNLSLLLPGGGPSERSERLCGGFAGPGAASDVLRETLPCLSFLCLAPCRLTAQGELPDAEAAPSTEAAREAGVLPFLTVTNLGETGGFSSENAHALFSDPAARDRALDALPEALAERRCAGVNFHFQYLYPFDREGYTRFLSSAAERLHALGYYLFVTLAPRESDGQEGILCAGQDYAVLGGLADRVVLLSCQWGYPYSAPQAISPIGRVRRTLDYACSVLPAERLLMSLASGGCRWRLPWRQGDAGAPIGSAEAVDLAVSVGAELKYDPGAEAPFFTYADPTGARWVVWFEDARSLRAKLALAEDYGVGLCWRSVGRLFRPALLLQQERFDAVKLL